MRELDITVIAKVPIKVEIDSLAIQESIQRDIQRVVNEALTSYLPKENDFSVTSKVEATKEVKK